jgi:prepilin-type N-terminal cleavage/methylation domain-containing protein
MERTRKRLEQGITAIELLIVISVLAILVVFAAPVVSSAFWTSEVDEAVKVAEKSVREARTLARLYQTNVVVRIESDKGQRPSITVTVPSRHKAIDVGEVRDEVALPGDVEVLGGDVMVQFNPAGEVDLPAMVMLASRADQRQAQKLIIE